MRHASKSELVFAIYPTTLNFAFVLFEGPLSPYDWGIKGVNQNDKNASILEQVKKLIDQYRPDAIVIEDTSEKESRRSVRIRKLYRLITRLAETEYVPLFSYSKEAVRKCFESAGVSTKHDIASAIAREIPAFINQLPRKRKAWTTEDRKQALFDAAALGITHYVAQSGKQSISDIDFRSSRA